MREGIMGPRSQKDKNSSRKEFGVGFWIWWNRSDESRGGPAQVWMVVLSNQRRWVYVEFEGEAMWVHEDRITEIVSGSGCPRKPIGWS